MRLSAWFPVKIIAGRFSLATGCGQGSGDGPAQPVPIGRFSGPAQAPSAVQYRKKSSLPLSSKRSIRGDTQVTTALLIGEPGIAKGVVKLLRSFAGGPLGFEAKHALGSPVFPACPIATLVRATVGIRIEAAGAGTRFLHISASSADPIVFVPHRRRR